VGHTSARNRDQLATRVSIGLRGRYNVCVGTAWALAGTKEDIKRTVVGWCCGWNQGANASS
jgi:hypothetical protein